jgi:hypothetical protein
MSRPIITSGTNGVRRCQRLPVELRTPLMSGGSLITQSRPVPTEIGAFPPE